jgi:hypothetical protein
MMEQSECFKVFCAMHNPHGGAFAPSHPSRLSGKPECRRSRRFVPATAALSVIARRRRKLAAVPAEPHRGCVGSAF